MLPMIPNEAIAGSAELIVCFFTIVAALASCLFAMRF